MAKVTVNCGNVSVEAEGQKELFETLALYQEVFDVERCPEDPKHKLRYRVREVDGNKYYEIVCLDCWAKLSFGQHKNGKSLFPKTWTRWNKGTEQEVEL